MSRRGAVLIIAVLMPVVSVVLGVLVNVATGGSIAGIATPPAGLVWACVLAVTVVSMLLAWWQVRHDRRTALTESAAAEMSTILSDAGAPRSDRVVLDSVPGVSGPFVGRSGELDQIVAALRSARRDGAAGLVAIHGAPGVGKSTLARIVPSQLRAEYPDARLFVRMRSIEGRMMRAPEALRVLLIELGVQPSSIPRDMPARVAMLSGILGTRRVLIVVDDAVDEAQVRPLLAASGRSGIIVTSRRPLGGLDLSLMVRLGPLLRSDSVALIDLIVSEPKRLRDRHQIEEIARLCDDLPLALRIAAALLRAHGTWDVGDLAGRLADERRRLEVLQLGDLSVRASLAISYRELSVPQRKAFRYLGLIDVPWIPLTAIAGLNAVHVDQAAILIDALVESQLVELRARNHYTLHSLVRLYARELVERDDGRSDRDAAAVGALTALVDWSRAAATTLMAPTLLPQVTTALSADTDPAHRRPASTEPPVPVAEHAPTAETDPRIVEALDWFENEHAVVVAAIRQAADLGAHALVCELAGFVCWFLTSTGRVEDALDVCALAVAAADAVGADAARATAWTNYGAALRHNGKHAEARVASHTAVELCLRVGDRADAGRAMATLGQIYRETNQLLEAATWYRRSIDPLLESGLPVAAAGALSDYGQVLKMQGRLTEAGDAMVRALDIAQAYPGFVGARTLAWAAENLGAVRKRQGRITESVLCHVRSFRYFDTLGDVAGRAYALRNLGDLALVAGQGVLARRYYAVSLEWFEGMRSAAGMGQAYTSLAVAESRRLHLGAALAAIRAATRCIGVRPTLRFAAQLMAILLLRDPKAGQRELARPTQP